MTVLLGELLKNLRWMDIWTLPKMLLGNVAHLVVCLYIWLGSVCGDRSVSLMQVRRRWGRGRVVVHTLKMPVRVWKVRFWWMEGIIVQSSVSFWRKRACCPVIFLFLHCVPADKQMCSWCSTSSSTCKKCSSTERRCLLYHHSHQLFQFESALLETFAKKTHFRIAVETSVKTNAM